MAVLPVPGVPVHQQPQRIDPQPVQQAEQRHQAQRRLPQVQGPARPVILPGHEEIDADEQKLGHSPHIPALIARPRKAPVLAAQGGEEHAYAVGRHRGVHHAGLPPPACSRAPAPGPLRRPPYPHGERRGQPDPQAEQGKVLEQHVLRIAQVPVALPRIQGQSHQQGHQVQIAQKPQEFVISVLHRPRFVRFHLPVSRFPSGIVRKISSHYDILSQPFCQQNRQRQRNSVAIRAAGSGESRKSFRPQRPWPDLWPWPSSLWRSVSCPAGCSVSCSVGCRAGDSAEDSEGASPGRPLN